MPCIWNAFFWRAGRETHCFLFGIRRVYLPRLFPGPCQYSFGLKGDCFFSGYEDRSQPSRRTLEAIFFLMILKWTMPAAAIGVVGGMTKSWCSELQWLKGVSRTARADTYTHTCNIVLYTRMSSCTYSKCNNHCVDIAVSGGYQPLCG